jgi:hypothetical protein
VVPTETDRQRRTRMIVVISSRMTAGTEKQLGAR